VPEEPRYRVSGSLEAGPQPLLEQPGSEDPCLRAPSFRSSLGAEGGQPPSQARPRRSMGLGRKNHEEARTEERPVHEHVDHRTAPSMRAARRMATYPAPMSAKAKARTAWPAGAPKGSR
jgi:hypothetical protein